MTDPALYTTRLLTLDTWTDFAALVEANNGVWGGCWCIGFHPAGIARDGTAAGNRKIKHAHVADGTASTNTRSCSAVSAASTVQ
jgi:hypothetical protein